MGSRPMSPSGGALLYPPKGWVGVVAVRRRPYSPRWVSAEGSRRIFLQQAQSVTQWASFMQTNSPGAPLGRDIVSRAVGHPATATPQLKSRQCGAPTGHLQGTMLQADSAGKELQASAQWPGNCMPPVKQHRFPQPLRPGWCTTSELLPPRVPRCCKSGQNTLGVDPWKLAERSPPHGGSVWQLPSKSRPFRPPLGGAPVEGEFFSPSAQSVSKQASSSVQLIRHAGGVKRPCHAKLHPYPLAGLLPTSSSTGVYCHSLPRLSGRAHA